MYHGSINYLCMYVRMYACKYGTYPDDSSDNFHHLQLRLGFNLPKNKYVCIYMYVCMYEYLYLGHAYKINIYKHTYIHTNTAHLRAE